LGEYALEIIDHKKAQIIKQHLTECPHCQTELKQLSNYLDELADDLDLSLIERVKVRVGKLISQTGTQMPSLAPALRGDSEEVRLYQAGEAQVSLQVQVNSQDPKLRDISGLMIGIKPGDWHASLWQDGRQAAATEVDELSSFSLKGISPRGFTLILSNPENEIHIEVEHLT
jgi:hypothetical protein